MNLVENKTEKTIKTLRIDRCHEYLSKQFKKLCDENGFKDNNSSHLQQNGVAERRNHIFLEMIRLMMA